MFEVLWKDLMFLKLFRWPPILIYDNTRKQIKAEKAAIVIIL